jgi:glycosyltransferase involved in cell wall biosynthesis
LYVLADRLTSPLAHRIVAVSHAIAGDLVHRYGIHADKVVTIWNGIDPISFLPRRGRHEVLEEFGLRDDDRLIGIAARMTPQKGHEVLLQALHFLLPRFPRLRCLIIGDGPLESALRDQAAALGITPQCIFTGARTDVADLLSAVEVAVLPSRSEGLPFFLLEAMTLGKPVVATRVSGIPEVVEEGRTGFLTPPEDARAMADSLALLLEHPEEAVRMGERGRQRVCEHFSLARMTAALEDLYLSSIVQPT